MRILIRLLVLLVLAMPVVAAKRRAVAFPQTRQVALSAEVFDANTGKRVVDVNVSTPSGGAVGDAGGRFIINIPFDQDVPITLSRGGYETVTEVVRATADTQRTFQMTAKPTTVATTKSGITYEISKGTLEFGYLLPFQGYAKDSKIEVCRPGGTKSELTNDNLRRLIGPATAVTDPACCAQGQAMAVDAELQSGERFRALFTGFCDTRQTEIIARDHETWQLIFIPIGDLAELTVR